MRNIVVQLEYDGTDFVGSQLQANGRTIQGELERAWRRFTNENRRWTFAGRTDAGVHATGQVANIHSETIHPLATIQRALNALLPADMAVRSVQEVAHEFHARFSAVRREYRYTILNERCSSPLLRRTAWHVAMALDVAAMESAAARLQGTHDFAAFGVVDAGPTVRTCFEAACGRVVCDGRQLMHISLAANGFLRHMVRAVVGTLVEVGMGKRSVEEFAAVLQSRDRTEAGPTAPPHGLSLTGVTYPAPYELAASG